jgi:adenylosuccinate lyase
MIPRYARPEMTEIWSAKSKFRIWFEIEAHACDAQAALGVIPKEAAKAVWERGDLILIALTRLSVRPSMTLSRF